MPVRLLISLLFSLLLSSCTPSYASKHPFMLIQNAGETTSCKPTVVHLHYAQAETLQKTLSNTDPDLIKNKSAIVADKHTNSLIICTNQQQKIRLLKLVASLDHARKQILIKAKIISIDNQYAKQLGINYLTERSKDETEKAIGSAGLFSIPIASLSSVQRLNIEIHALIEQGHAKIMSNPQLITSNRGSAFIEAGEEIPYQEQTANGGTSVAFKNAAMKLQVTPTILPGKQLLLKLDVHQDKVSTLTVQGVPAIKTQRLQTQALLKNQHTLVLGGIYETINSTETDSVPILGDIPLLGRLFKNTHSIKQRHQLLILVTPVILEH